VFNRPYLQRFFLIVDLFLRVFVFGGMGAAGRLPARTCGTGVAAAKAAPAAPIGVEW